MYKLFLGKVKLMKKETVREEALNFLIYSYLGIAPKKMFKKDDVIKKCANRAYLDLCRTLTFNKEKTEIEKQNFRNEMTDLFEDGKIFALLDKEISTIKDLDKTIYDDIETVAKKYKEMFVCDCPEDGTESVMNFGQIQKWVNMTIKYMYLCGVWKDEFTDDRIKNIHVPIDSYILRASSSNNRGKGAEIKAALAEENFLFNENIMLPLKSGEKEKQKLFCDMTLPWSRWDKGQYLEYQKSIKKECIRKGLVPMQWEAKAWIIVAEIMNSK